MHIFYLLDPWQFFCVADCSLKLTQHTNSSFNDCALHGESFGENMLKRFGINLKTLDVTKLRNDYNALYAKKETLQKTYKTAEKDIQSLSRKLDNLNEYLDRAQTPEQTKNHTQKKDSATL